MTWHGQPLHKSHHERGIRGRAVQDWVLDEKFATSMAKDFGYRMTTTPHMKNLTPSEIKEMQLDDIGGLISKLFVEELPENLNEWVQAWSEFKSA